MKDRIQQRLEAESASCEDPIQRALIDAERAYHAARAGDFQSSRRLLSAIRGLPRAYFAPTVAIWVMLSEGIVEFFEDLNPHAQDRFRRAYALGVSIGSLDLQALASAWLAHIELNRRNYQAMVSSANQCLAIYPRGQSSSHARIFMVLANANLYAGNLARANAFYERARTIAIADGDRSTVGAIVYNRAVLLLNNFRLQALLDVGDNIDIGLVSMAVESAATFQNITQNRSLGELSLMGEARLAAMKGDFPFALKIFDKIRSSDHRHRGGAKDPLLDIEYASCLMRSGDVKTAEYILGSMSMARYIELDNDDRIIFFSQLIDICSKIDCNLSIEDPGVLLRRAITDFSNELVDLRNAIASIEFGAGEDV
jgi:tetratricopeptide (TPR) repeat protein